MNHTLKPLHPSIRPCNSTHAQTLRLRLLRERKDGCTSEQGIYEWATAAHGTEAWRFDVLCLPARDLDNLRASFRD